MSKKVLIVDDMKSVRMYVKMLLQSEGYELDEAENGAEALKRIESAPPDVVLMDMLMPRMDGIECCRRIKGDPSIMKIPVIMVTTRGEKENIRDANNAGCDAYLTKPIKKLELLDKIQQLVDR